MTRQYSKADSSRAAIFRSTDCRERCFAGIREKRSGDDGRRIGSMNVLFLGLTEISDINPVCDLAVLVLDR